MFRSSCITVALLTAALSGTVIAAPMLVDRGLPTANLNNAAGSNRSNVAWTEGGNNPALYEVDGDTFTNTSAQSWSIDTIRMWTVEPNMTTASLWGGTDGSTIGVVSGSGVISSATYADGTTYQGSSGGSRAMQQVDFAVNITLAAGQTYDFFLSGTDGDYAAPFSHASNSALSGSPQEGADGSMLWAQVVGGVLTVGGMWDSNQPGAWDKSSDINVQVFGNAIPEPASLALFGLALAGLAVSRRRKV